MNRIRSMLLLGLWMWSATANGDHPALAAAQEFRSALAAGNEERVLAVLAEDVLVYEQGGIERSRSEYAAHHLPNDIAFLEHLEAEVKARQILKGETVVVILSEVRQFGTYKGERVDSVTTETLVLTETPAGWRIRHVHWSQDEG